MRFSPRLGDFLDASRVLLVHHTTTRDDEAPPGSQPMVVFFAPAQLDALMLHADEVGLAPQTVLRRALRAYLHTITPQGRV